jgi:hypothetical protein
MLEIRCSGLARAMACAGHLFFEDLPEDVSSPAAQEGTACGELLRHMLEGTQPPAEASNGLAFDEDMWFHMRPIADSILANASGPVRCEQRIDWRASQGVVIRGSYDVSYIGKDGRLWVEDLKYGWGLVEAKENWQLLGYAIGESIRLGGAHGDIALRIRQPRPHHEDGPCRTWELTKAELAGYAQRISARAAEIEAGEKGLATGAHCRYCRAALACPAAGKAFFRGVEVAHEFVQDSVDDRELGFQLTLIDRVAEMVKLKADALKALAAERIARGGIVDGYVTEAAYGDRKWKKGVSPEVIRALTGKDVVEQTMLSPAKAEKIGVPKEVVSQLVERRFVGNKLVRKDSGSIGDRIFGAPKLIGGIN